MSGKPQRLTPLETLIMQDLWEHAPSTVKAARDRLESSKPMAYNTVLTVMRILRDKGFLVSERVGRSDRYRPTVSRDQMARRSLRETLNSFFAGSSSALVSNLLDGEDLGLDELARIRRLVDERLAGEKGADS